MFTGIVETTGEVKRHGASDISIGASFSDDPLIPGESIAVDGVCLTVVTIHPWGFTADVSPETKARTTLGRRRTGSRVNLERSLKLSSRLGGHLVMGHVDATVSLISRRPEGGSERFRFQLPTDLRPYVAMKGSVALDGISLTVAGLDPSWFEVALIPHTLRVTTLGSRRPSDPLNMEVDVLARYAESILSLRPSG